MKEVMIEKGVAALQFNYEKLIYRYISYWKRFTIKRNMIRRYYSIIKGKNEQFSIMKYFYRYVKKYS